MSLANKLMMASMALGMMTFTSSAVLAADDVETSKEDAILFRIENIRPVANEEGITEKCAFTMTVYNRMPEEITEASLTLKWQDNIESKYKVTKDSVEVNDAKAAVQTIEKAIVLDTIPSHIQRSLEYEGETNKCFLLLDSIDYTVDNCIVAGEKVIGKDSKVSTEGGSCVNKFDYISSQNPEYYSEFKEKPDSVMERQAATAEGKEQEAIDVMYEETVQQLQKIENALNKIK